VSGSDFRLGQFIHRNGCFRNQTAATLVEQALVRGEAQLSSGGCLVARTGIHTGRSPKDKFIVRDENTETEVWWDDNTALSPAHFEQLFADMLQHAETRELFVQDLEAGAEPSIRVRVRVFTEFAWHSLFIRNLLIRPKEAGNAAPNLTILDCPSFRADPVRHGCRSTTVIACDFSRGIVLIGGTAYAGEMKKAVFTYLSYVLPARGVMPMHCSANVGRSGDVAIFFGLSGTGKTTLSADPERPLIGDDEHGWGERGIFNFEGGCYAKAIHLSAEREPEIFATTGCFGTVMENVVLHAETRVPNFEDASLTENTRVAYPLDVIPGAVMSGRVGQPKTLVMLTCDAFGVLPPLARLTPDQAVYHFLSGYTAKVAGTERGVNEPEATFSTCFGAPFMPRHPMVYGALLRDLIRSHGVQCWLLNTGWTGGSCGMGSRMPLSITRRLLSAALDGSLLASCFHTEPYFGLSVPTSAPGIAPKLLHPVETWADAAAFEAAAARLIAMFRDNFCRLEDGVEAEILRAAPRSLMTT
jgi:phosphoenolpyruvate carboxykinase (ATP)